MSEKTPPDVVRWYTRARKFPQLIGRTPDGAKLWGGPYTITQAVGAGLTLFVGLNTMELWASFGFVGNFLVLAVATYGVVLGLGRIPVGARSPLSVAAGAYKALASPAHGRLGGKAVRLRRPHRVRHTVVLRLDHLINDPAAVQNLHGTTSTAPTSPAAPSSPTSKPALTGVQSLLAGASQLPRPQEVL